MSIRLVANQQTLHREAQSWTEADNQDYDILMENEVEVLPGPTMVCPLPT
jgi:hypothetical protein